MKTKTPTSKYGQHNLLISKVKNAADGNPKKLEIPWQDVIDRCFEPKVHGDLNHSEYLKARKSIRDAQKDGPAFIGGAFSKPNTRTTDAMESYCLTILDFFDGHYTFDELVEALALAGIECVVFTTYGHSKKRGKFRALVLLDKPIRENIQATLDAIIDYFETLLGPHIGKACRTPSQVIYSPAYPPGGEKYFRSEHIAGKPLRVADFKNAIPAKQLPVDSGQHGAAIDTSFTDCPELPEKAMPGWIGEFVKRVCKDSEVHPSAVLISLLLRFCAEILGPYIKIGDVKHRARTNAVIVGNTSKARKGTSFAPIEALFAGLENSARVSPGPLSTGEGLVEAVRDESRKFDKKKQMEVITDPGVTDKRLFVHDEEFANALAKIRALSGVIRRLFDSGNVEPLIRHNKYKTTGAHVVILTHITKLELTSSLNKVQMGNGFANRFLWFLVHRVKNVPLPPPLPVKELECFKKILAERIKAAKGLGEMCFSEKARKLYTEAYDELTTEYPGVVGAIVGRSEAHVVRASLIYALAAGHTEVKVQDLRAALALVKTSNASVFTIFKDTDNGVRQGDNRKDKILQALRAKLNKELSTTEIYEVFNKRITKAEVNKMMQELVLSQAVIIMPAEKTGGADKKSYKLAAKITD